MNIQIIKYYDMESDSGHSIGERVSLWDYINKIETENKVLKEQNTILQNQNKDLLTSLESLKSE